MGGKWLLEGGVEKDRTIIIGDVHGCHLELLQLLREVEVRPSRDRIIFLGDLINKGPASRRVWEIMRRVDGESILGNHELSMLAVLDGDRHKHEKYRDDLRRDFGDDLRAFIDSVRTWPLWIETEDVLIVHAGLQPGVWPQDTDPWVLTTIRTWDGRGADLLNRKNPAWFDLYEGKKPVVFGHWASLGGLNRENAIGLDTGCVYGGQLSCLILPERRFVRVQARETYCLIKH